MIMIKKVESGFPAIIVIAYNRFDCLKRLLNSLTIAEYPNETIQLIIQLIFQETMMCWIMQKLQWTHETSE